MNTGKNKPIRDFIKGFRAGFSDTYKVFSDNFGIPLWVVVVSSVLTTIFTIILLINIDYIISMIPILFIVHIVVIAYALHGRD